MIFPLIVLFMAVLLRANLQIDNESSHQVLQRRQCIWNSQKNAHTCNAYLPTIAQLVWALRNPELGKVGPETVIFFYSNLFESEVTEPTVEQGIDVLLLCYEWLQTTA